MCAWGRDEVQKIFMVTFFFLIKTNEYVPYVSIRNRRRKNGKITNLVAFGTNFQYWYIEFEKFRFLPFSADFAADFSVNGNFTVYRRDSKIKTFIGIEFNWNRNGLGVSVWMYGCCVGACFLFGVRMEMDDFLIYFTCLTMPFFRGAGTTAGVLIFYCFLYKFGMQLIRFDLCLSFDYCYYCCDYYCGCCC